MRESYSKRARSVMESNYSSESSECAEQTGIGGSKSARASAGREGIELPDRRLFHARAQSASLRICGVRLREGDVRGASSRRAARATRSPSGGEVRRSRSRSSPTRHARRGTHHSGTKVDRKDLGGAEATNTQLPGSGESRTRSSPAFRT